MARRLRRCILELCRVPLVHKRRGRTAQGVCFTYAPEQRLRVFGSMDGSREAMLQTPNPTEICPANAAPVTRGHAQPTQTCYQCYSYMSICATAYGTKAWHGVPHSKTVRRHSRSQLCSAGPPLNL